MRRLVCVLLLLPAVGLAPAHAATTVKVQLSNFRFCADSASACTPADIAYAPDLTKGGVPLAEQYNPNAVITAHRGDTVQWRYADTGGCDAISICPGHEVRLASGTVVGYMTARNGVEYVRYTIPLNAHTGYLPYRCTINQHYQYGMTGVLNVL
jgi:plastocyanin